MSWKSVSYRKHTKLSTRERGHGAGVEPGGSCIRPAAPAVGRGGGGGMAGRGGRPPLFKGGFQGERQRWGGGEEKVAVGWLIFVDWMTI